MYRKGIKDNFEMLYVACIQVEGTWDNFLSAFPYFLNFWEKA